MVQNDLFSKVRNSDKPKPEVPPAIATLNLRYKLEYEETFRGLRSI